MRLIVNGLFVRPGVNGGTETYCNELCRQWYDGTVTLPDLHVLHYCTVRPSWGAQDKPAYGFVETGAFRSQLTRIAFEQLRLPSRVAAGSIVFNPGYVGLLARRHPQVTTVHDAYAWTQPSSAGRLRGLYWRRLVPATAQRAVAIITVSRSTDRDLRGVAGWPAIPSTVIHEAGDHVHRLQANDGIRRKYELRPQGYFLAVGVFKQIKNPEVLLAVYALYRERCPAHALHPRDLVLCGAIVHGYGRNVAQKAAMIRGVKLAGRIGDSALKDLYQNAAGLLFVSKYEGFGIPILEAQELGCPVVTGDRSSMPEVAGEGALVVPTDDPQAITRAMLRLHDHQTIATLRSVGAQNCRKFAWKIAARQTLEVLQTAESAPAESCP